MEMIYTRFFDGKYSDKFTIEVNDFLERIQTKGAKDIQFNYQYGGNSDVTWFSLMITYKMIKTEILEKKA